METSGLFVDCTICGCKLKKKSMRGHIQSKKHQVRLGQIQKECRICVEKQQHFIPCNLCKQDWCLECDKKIFKCPFCRYQIQGREEQEIQRANEQINWYSNSESMDEIRITVFLNDNFQENINTVISNIQQILQSNADGSTTTGSTIVSHIDVQQHNIEELRTLLQEIRNLTFDEDLSEGSSRSSTPVEAQEQQPPSV
jgi:hypothetical protein